MAILIPLLQQGSPNLVTNAEWQQFHDNVNAWETQATLDIHAINPNAVTQQAPPVWGTNITTATRHRGCATIVTAWLHQVQQMETNLLHQLNLQQQVAAAVAATIAGLAPPLPPPPPPPPHNIPIPHACVKAALPKAFTGDRRKTHVFMQSYKNYFALTPNMTDEEQIQFTLQLVKGEAEFWKETALNNMDQHHPPNWANDWVLFRAHFET